MALWLSKEIAPAIRAVLKKYNMEGSIAIRDHSTLCVTIESGDIDFDIRNELLDAMKGPKYFTDDGSGADYFHRIHYTDITIGDLGVDKCSR